MILYRWVLLGYVALAFVFIGEAGISLYESNAVFSTTTLIFASGLCLYSITLLQHTRGLSRSIFLLVSIALAVGYLGRFALLTLDPSRYQYDFLVPLIDPIVRQSFLHIVLGLGALWLGLRIATRKVIVQDWSSRLSTHLMPHRHLLIVAAAITISVQMALRVFFGYQLTTTDMGYLVQVLNSSTGVLGFAIMYLAVLEWRRLRHGEKAAILLVFAGEVLSDFVSGGRGGILIPLLSLTVIVIATRPDMHIPKKVVLVVAAGALLLGPSYLESVHVVRDTVRSPGGSFFGALYEGFEPSSTFSFIDTVWEVSDRFGTIDLMLIGMAYRAPGLDLILTVGNTLKTVVNTLTPDSLISFHSVHLGKAFGVLYQGLPEDVAHSGAWSGPGILYQAFGRLDWLAFGVLGYLIGAGVQMVERRNPWFVLLALFLLLFLWHFVMSGNIDILLGGLIINAVLSFVLMLVLAMLPQRSRTPVVRTAVASSTTGQALLD